MIKYGKCFDPAGRPVNPFNLAVPSEITGHPTVGTWPSVPVSCNKTFGSVMQLRRPKYLHISWCPVMLLGASFYSYFNVTKRNL